MFDGLIDILLDFLKQAIEWLYGVIVEAADAALQPIADALPDLSADVGFIYQYGALANEWCSLEYGFTLLAAWFVVIPLILLLKWILGLVPTIN